MYGNSAAFFVVSTAFSRRQDGESYPCAAENRLQRRAERACAGLRRGAGPSIRATAEGRRMGAQQPVCGAAWAWPLAAIGGAKRGSAEQARAITDAMQTNAINEGSGQRGYWGSSQFFYFTLHFYQKDCARVWQKNRSGREQLTPSPPIFDFDHGGCEHRQGAKR